MKFLTHLRTAALVVCIDALAFLTSYAAELAPEHDSMKPSITYLHLLRHTPFFTELDTSQLRWTIDHSKEWEVQPGTVIATCASGDEVEDEAIWILLDGRWQVEENGRSHSSGNADSGKWFSAQAVSQPCRLVVTKHSYVMRITRLDMERMLKLGFKFGAHLEAGKAYYDDMFDQNTLN